MSRSGNSSAALTVVALATAVLLTRVEHFGSQLALPDVTLAAFFLAGLWVRSRWAFPALLLTAGLADQWAFARGVSDWCVSPAYPFLVPTYACLWWAGHESRGFAAVSLSVSNAAKLGANLLSACVAAFVVSSGSFFLLSHYFPGMSGLAYWRATARYFPPYAGWAFAYVSIALAVQTMLTRGAQPRRFTRPAR